MSDSRIVTTQPLTTDQITLTRTQWIAIDNNDTDWEMFELDLEPEVYDKVGVEFDIDDLYLSKMHHSRMKSMHFTHDNVFVVLQNAAEKLDVREQLASLNYMYTPPSVAHRRSFRGVEPRVNMAAKLYWLPREYHTLFVKQILFVNDEGENKYTDVIKAFQPIQSALQLCIDTEWSNTKPYRNPTPEMLYPIESIDSYIAQGSATIYNAYQHNQLDRLIDILNRAHFKWAQKFDRDACTVLRVITYQTWYNLNESEHAIIQYSRTQKNTMIRKETFIKSLGRL